MKKKRYVIYYYSVSDVAKHIEPAYNSVDAMVQFRKKYGNLHILKTEEAE